MLTVLGARQPSAIIAQEEVLNALREAPFSRRYLVEHTAGGWVETQPSCGPMSAAPET
ncbi:hypothetical protein ACFFSH_29745 [Streptomyces filamentosus]|uniref:Uncharacterized protein n=1 Tax=Streptomyces filamentosus TaxID=67294 RepID=A0A919BUX9_STRFL|nr:hypothetical protein [Streptomyces filamentosus]GHG12735.1 hypothetical protein GCM10017667_52860 [Streptomyces filamentosus]